MPDRKHMLLIAEKPDLMRKIQACYKAHRSKIPYDITFTSQRGHLVTLKYPDEIDEELKDWSWDTLPINPMEHGGWQYKVIEEKKTGNYMTTRERYDYIKKEIYSGAYDGVINAGDPDQEGELLVRAVLTHCRNRLPIKRFWTNDLTENHILDALLNLRDDEHDRQLVNLLNAAYGRQRADYLFGMNLSRAASLKMGARVAVGRVKTPILSIVCKREDEIRDFVPRTVYCVKAHYEEGFDGVLTGEGDGEEFPEDDEEERTGSQVRWFEKEEDARKVADSLRRAPVITQYVTKRQSSYAPKLFKLATAQIEAGKMGYSAADTLRIIQGLYEKKLLSYPRTGCEYLGGDEDLTEMLNAAGCIPELRKYVDSISYKDIARVKKTKTWINPKELEKEGHSALVPTTTHPDWPDLDKEERDIYRMVCAQFVAPFLPPLVQDRTTLVAETDGHEFKSTGKTLVDPGWTVVFGRSHADTFIPDHKEGDVLVVTQYEVADRTTKCPKRYTTADLIAICENPLKHLDNKAYRRLGKRLKIGTPATRAGIIEELIKTDKYMKTEKDHGRDVVAPTRFGQAVIENIHDCVICKVDLTGEWEEQLEKVRGGELSLEEIDRYMMEHVSAQVEEFRNKDMKKIESESDYLQLGECPLCGKTLMRGPTRYYCTGYRDGCRAGGAIEKNGAALAPEEFLDMLSGAVITKKMSKGGIEWDQKIACEKGTGKIIYPNEYSCSGMKCPVCGADIMESMTAYRCANRDSGKCGVFMPKVFGGVRIPEDQFRKLFEKGKTDVITGFHSEKSGKDYNAYMTADKEQKKIVPKYSDPEISTDYLCPVCGKPVIRKGFWYLCSGRKDGSCSFAMPAVVSKEDLPASLVKKMLRMAETGEAAGGEKAFVTGGDMETDYKCPCCGGKMMRNGLWFKCSDEDCGFRFYRIRSGHVMSEDEIGRLTEDGDSGVISDFVSKKKKSGKTYSARLKVDVEERKLTMQFEDKVSVSGFKCPVCGKPLDETPGLLSCGCGMKIWKTQGGRKLTEHELEDLTAKGETGYLKMKTKDGKKEYMAKLVVDKNEKKIMREFRNDSYGGEKKR